VRLRIDIRLRDLHELRVGAVVGAAEDAEVAARSVLALAPVEAGKMTTSSPVSLRMLAPSDPGIRGRENG